MKTKTKIEILKCQNNFINQLIEILKGETGLKEIGDKIHPIRVNLEFEELSFFARRYESNAIKERIYKSICDSNNKVKLDFGLFHLFSDKKFSTCAFKDEISFEYCLE